MDEKDMRIVPVETLQKAHEFVMRIWSDVHLNEYEEELRQEVEDLIWVHLSPHDDHNDQEWSKLNDN